MILPVLEIMYSQAPMKGRAALYRVDETDNDDKVRAERQHFSARAPNN